MHHLYDGKDRIVQTIVTVYGDATAQFLFDRMGRNRQSIDPNGVLNTAIFDSLGRKASLNNPDQNASGASAALQYTYDAATGFLASRTDAAQDTIVYGYDLLGRVVTATFRDGRKFIYQYDTAENGAGRIATIEIKQGTSLESSRTFAYDEYGNITQETLAINGEDDPFITRSRFDPVGRLVERILPDSSVLKRSFSNGLLSAQSLDGAQVTYSGFTPIGNYSSMSYDNGIEFSYQLNPLDQIYGESVYTSSHPLLASSYQYDSLNQVLRIDESQEGENTTQLFSYCGKRLVAATIPGFDSASYLYDRGGNLQAKNESHYSYNAHFPFEIQNGGASIYSATQDACGRTLSRTRVGRMDCFQYDGLGELCLFE
jgi:YD repeat-containing protein